MKSMRSLVLSIWCGEQPSVTASSKSTRSEGDSQERGRKKGKKRKIRKGKGGMARPAHVPLVVPKWT